MTKVVKNSDFQAHWTVRPLKSHCETIHYLKVTQSSENLMIAFED